MRIIRETDNGGRFVAPIRVNFKMTFTPASGISARRLELTQHFLNRINALGKKYNCFITLDPETSLKQAQAADNLANGLCA